MCPVWPVSSLWTYRLVSAEDAVTVKSQPFRELPRCFFGVRKVHTFYPILISSITDSSIQHWRYVSPDMFTVALLVVDSTHNIWCIDSHIRGWDIRPRGWDIRPSTTYSKRLYCSPFWRRQGQVLGRIACLSTKVFSGVY